MSRRTIALAIAASAGLAWASACGDGTTEPPADPPRPKTVMVSPQTVLLTALGDTVQLTTEVRDQYDQVMVGVRVVWRISNANVAAVSGSGLVTARADGTATVTAMARGVRGTAQITVADRERAALEAFYHATGGPEWKLKSHWLSNWPLYVWHGVRTDTTGRVVENRDGPGPGGEPQHCHPLFGETARVAIGNHHHRRLRPAP